MPRWDTASPARTDSSRAPQRNAAPPQRPHIRIAQPILKALKTCPATTTQWLILVLLSVVLVVVAEGLRLPAAMLLGPLLAGVAVGISKSLIRVSAAPFVGAQGVIGLMIGSTIPLSTLGDVVRDWPVFLAGVLSVILVASTLGWLLARAQALPGTTAIWGTSPGASTAMIVMSDMYGADARLVAIMQHLRVACVIFTAAIVARLGATSSPGAQAAQAVWLVGPASWTALSATIVVGLSCSFLGWWLKISSAPFILPFIAGMILHDTGLVQFEFPHWLLAISYAVIGWSVGLRFTWSILVYAARAMPSILMSTFGLIAACALIAAGLVFAAGVDPMTAFLATSPGGVDSMAIIAASSDVDVHFVMTMQTARLVIVMLISPGLSRFIATRLTPPAPS